MNFFEYTLKIQELERAKYKKQFDAIMRQMVDSLKNMSGHGGWGNAVHAYINENNFEATKLHYKVFAKAINNIKDMNGIADFISHSFYNLEKSMSSYVAKNGDYEMYLDVFEYSQDIEADSREVTAILIPYITLIGDNEYPYKISFNTHVSSGYCNLTFEAKKSLYYDDKHFSNGTSMRQLIELEDLRNKFDSTKRWTVLEELLDEVYSNPAPNNAHTDNALEQTRESARRILETIDRVIERSNGQLPVQTTAA